MFVCVLDFSHCTEYKIIDIHRNNEIIVIAQDIVLPEMHPARIRSIFDRLVFCHRTMWVLVI